MEPVESGNSINLQPQELNIVKNVSFPVEVSDKLFIRSHFVDVGAKKTVFNNCNFSHSIFTRTYFRDAKFIDCTFIGARFYDCNFRHAELTRCDFKYATFKDTIIPVGEVIANLPEWPNVKRELLQSHRSNAQSIGDADAVKIYIREEMTALREHYRRARERKEKYYADKYAGVARWIEVRWRSFSLWLGWVIWGYGEYPGHLLRFTSVSILLLSLVVFLQSGTLSENTTLSQIGSALWEGLKSTILIFLGLPQTDYASIHWSITTIIVLFRFIIFGLFISVLFRRFSKR